MKKKIYVCPNCGRALNFSEDANYTFYCGDCGDYFHEYEAATEEQARMEGIVDYTDLAKASMEIKAITDKAIKENERQVEIKSKDILGQVLEYISETIQPILDSGMYKEPKFIDCARIYTSNFELSFGRYIPNNKEHQAQLFGRNGNLRVYFHITDRYLIDNVVTGVTPYLVQDWQKLKDSMHRMIPYAIDECNKANQKKLEQQREKEQIINSFRL